MKMNSRLGAVLAIALMLSAAALASAQTKKAPGKAAPDAEFKALIDGYYKAWTIPEVKARRFPTTPPSAMPKMRPRLL